MNSDRDVYARGSRTRTFARVEEDTYSTEVGFSPAGSAVLTRDAPHPGDEAELMRATDALAVAERRNRELVILNAIATALNESTDLHTSLGVALSRVAELLDLRTGWVWLLDEATGQPYLAAAQNLPAALADYPERMEDGCYCLGKFRKGVLRGAANIVACSRLEWLTQGTAGLRYHASIPLYAGDKKLGVLNVASSTWRELTEDELKLLHIIGEMLGTAVERSRLYTRSMEVGAIEERNRLAREIHDTLAQGLSATVLQLETVEALVDSGAEVERVRATVRQALTTTRRNLEEARRSVLDLRPAPLEGRTLAEALHELCASPTGATGPSIHFRLLGGERSLPARVEVGLYRIAQESVSNVVRHASARRIGVDLTMQPGQVSLVIEDDGRGFEVEGSRPGRFGLIGMRERARLLGGELRLQSTPGAGTRIEAIVPLN